MSKKMKQQAISAWEIENKKREKAREQRGIKFVPEEEIDEYTKILGEAYQKLALPEIPSMPILAKPNAGGTSSRKAPDLIIASNISGGEPFNAEHQDNGADNGFASESWMAMVHTPVKDWQKREEARRAVDKEWDKLADKKAWILESVREYEQLRNEATSTGETYTLVT